MVWPVEIVRWGGGDDGGRDAMPLSAGNAVLYQQYAGMEFPADDAAPAGYVVLRSDNVMVRLD